jgi:malonyl-CoA O-methyltransferase
VSAPPDRFRFDRRALARAFERASGSYDAAATLQADVRQELLSRLELFKLEPRLVLDLGAGTCQASLALSRRYRGARVLALDLVPAMLQAAPRRWWRRPFERIGADAHALPLAANNVDLVVSNLMLQWCDEPDLVFAELRRVLRPGGLVLFSTFGPDTLRELRDAWTAADAGEHVSRFADVRQLGDALMRACLSEPVVDVEYHHRHYPDAYALMHEIKSIGAANAAFARGRGLTGRRRMQRMIDAYEAQRQAPGLPATFEVIFGAAFGTGAALDASRAPAATPATDADPGETRVPLERIGRARTDHRA